MSHCQGFSTWLRIWHTLPLLGRTCFVVPPGSLQASHKENLCFFFQGNRCYYSPNQNTYLATTTVISKDHSRLLRNQWSKTKLGLPWLILKRITWMGLKLSPGKAHHMTLAVKFAEEMTMRCWPDGRLHTSVSYSAPLRGQSWTWCTTRALVCLSADKVWKHRHSSWHPATLRGPQSLLPPLALPRSSRSPYDPVVTDVVLLDRPHRDQSTRQQKWRQVLWIVLILFALLFWVISKFLPCSWETNFFIWSSFQLHFFVSWSFLLQNVFHSL